MNISQLARQLGVSVSTVSRVLSGDARKYRISESTAMRILEAADRHHVSPDPLGAGLRKGRTGTVGLLVPDITNPFFAHLARAIELRLRERGIAVQLCDSAEDAVTEIALLRNLLARRIDGLILAPVGLESEALAEILSDRAMPVVILDRIIPGLALPSVSLDNFAAGRLAAEAVFERGHATIGCLRGNPDSVADQDRLAGVESAAHDSDAEGRRLVVAGAGYSLEESFHAASTLLDRPDRPTAVITLSGQGVLGVLEVARQLDRSIPGDFSLLAFDEQPWSKLISPPLATVSQPIEEMASQAADWLREDIETPNADTSRRGVFEASLTLRESLGAPPRK